jgi:5-methylcytosine-specific restriction endonuclease McrA
MDTNALVIADALSDNDLLSRLDVLAATEREASVERVAHLAALDSRRSLFVAQGYSSLFAYCREALRLSEDATCNRIEAARACRRFPEILDLLASGELSLSGVRLLGRHLTAENHESVLARARRRSCREIEVLVAHLAPRPDVPSTVRKLPAPVPVAAPQVVPLPRTAPPNPALPEQVGAAPVFLPPPRPIVQPTAPERYRVQFTIGEDTHDKLRRLQELMRPEIPGGDPAEIFDRALSLLLEKVEKAKCGRAASATRHVADTPMTQIGRRSPRTIPRWVRRAVWRRDGGRCAFVSRDGRRCTERHFLQYHHVIPWALGGPATEENISLRCRCHNQYESEVVFGPGMRETQDPRRASGTLSSVGDIRPQLSPRQGV